MLASFMESSGRSSLTLERALFNLDCGSIVLNKQFEVCREKYEDSDEYFVKLYNPLLSVFSCENLNESESKKLYARILKDVPNGRAKILFKYPNSFELI